MKPPSTSSEQAFGRLGAGSSQSYGRNGRAANPGVWRLVRRDTLMGGRAEESVYRRTKFVADMFSIRLSALTLRGDAFNWTR